MKLKEPATLELVDAIKDAYLAGYRRNTIAKRLCDEMDFKFDYAQALASKVWKLVMKDSSDREDGIKEKNLARLEHIYHKAMETGDLKNALSAIESLNKLCGLYKNKVELSTDEYVLDLLGNSEK